MSDKFPGIFLLVAVFVIAVCGLIYELLAAALSSYLLGGSVTQFSIVIGVFLTAMGLGSFLTRHIEDNLVDVFVGIQIGIGLSGGLSAAVLLLAFALAPTYQAILIIVLLVTGTMVGMEIPLLIRILEKQAALRITVSNVLALDYIGALIASSAFPLFLVPYLGLLRTSFLFGLLNIAVSIVALRVLSGMLVRKGRLKRWAYLSAIILTVGFATSGYFTSYTEMLLYQDSIILAKQTPYQRLIVTRWRGDFRLYIDGHLQFSSIDEHRYHECLVHPAASALKHAKRALILGGGDGMTARELLKHENIERIDLVDLDAEMIKLFKDYDFLARLSENALRNPKVHVTVGDAGKFLENSPDFWDLIIVDLPDPNNISLGRLYSKSFYKLAGRHLNRFGILVTQATSPYYAADAFWSINKTIKEASLGPEGDLRFSVYPYHVYIPSFGDWGFVIASREELNPDRIQLSDVPLKFLSQQLLPTLFIFPADALPKKDLKANRLDNQIIVNYYRRGWKQYSQ